MGLRLGGVSSTLSFILISKSAHVLLSDRISEVGWGSLNIHSKKSLSGDLQSYAAGYLEGFLTNKRIYSVGFYLSFSAELSDWCPLRDVLFTDALERESSARGEKPSRSQ